MLAKKNEPPSNGQGVRVLVRFDLLFSSFEHGQMVRSTRPLSQQHLPMQILPLRHKVPKMKIVVSEVQFADEALPVAVFDKQFTVVTGTISGQPYR
jgi:hypothetical protein